MVRPLVPTLLLAVALLAAGCVGKEEAASPEIAPEPGSESTVDTASTSDPTTTSAPTNTSASANATANPKGSNETKPADAPSNPGNCMRGMDMQGCTAAQADAYFDAQKANAPPPDKELPAVLIALDPQGANPEGAFTLDVGTMTLLVEIYLNNTGPGPYAALGPDGAGDLTLNFVGPTETTTITVGGRNAGIDPASPLADKTTAMLSMPAIGSWTITLDGQGTNAQVEIRLVERFYM